MDDKVCLGNAQNGIWQDARRDETPKEGNKELRGEESKELREEGSCTQGTERKEIKIKEKES